MPQFLTKLQMTEEDGFAVQLIAPLSFELGRTGSGRLYVVPAGFRTDFASVPRLLWPIFPPHGRARKAAVVHDYLYRDCPEFSRLIADSIFLAAMKASGVPFLQRWPMFLAVVAFGWMFKTRPKH